MEDTGGATSHEMEAKEAAATGMRYYEDFEPFCKWITDQTLEIDLKGFKKEQLKARTKRGILQILGDRPLDASSNKWSRFSKEFRLSKDCDVNEISAKFSRGVLSIVLPKKGQSLEKGAEKENRKEIGKKNSNWGVNIKKGTIIKVATVVVIVAVAAAIGTHIARLVNRHPHDTAVKDTAMNV